MDGVTWGEGLALAIGAKVNPYCVPDSLALVCSLQGRPPVIDRPVVLVNPRSKKHISLPTRGKPSRAFDISLRRLEISFSWITCP